MNISIHAVQYCRFSGSCQFGFYASSICSSSFTLLPSKSTRKQRSFFTSSNFRSQLSFLLDTLIKSKASSRSSTFMRSVIWFSRLSGGHALHSVTFDLSSAESTRSFAKFIRYRMSESRLIAPNGVNLLCCDGWWLVRNEKSGHDEVCTA